MDEDLTSLEGPYTLRLKNRSGWQAGPYPSMSVVRQARCQHMHRLNKRWEDFIVFNQHDDPIGPVDQLQALDPQPS